MARALAFGDVQGYTDAIRVLALEPALAAQYKCRLNERRLSLPLFDSTRYTREFEDLLGRMWARWQAGQAPAHLLAAGTAAQA